MSKYASKKFWVDTADRAVATFAQAMLATGVLESTGLVGIDWGGILSIAGGTALASVLSSVAFRGEATFEIDGRHIADSLRD